MEQQEINKMIAFFHTEEPVSCKWEDTWTEEEDSRTIIYVEYPEGKYVIKAAANDFTTTERVAGWVEMINNFREMGYYCPMLRKSRNGNYAEMLEVQEKNFVVWEEEFAKYSLPKDVKDKPKTADGKRYLYVDEKHEFVAKVGQKHFSNTWGDSLYVRLAPVGWAETDEVTDCVEEFKKLVKEKAPKFNGRLERVLALFRENQEKLEQVYFNLPTSVFQEDTGDNDLLLDEEGHFRGVLDYNLSGKDTVLNMTFEAIWYGGNESPCPSEDKGLMSYYCKEYTDAQFERYLEGLRKFREYYEFTEEEADAAMPLYRYIMTIGYDEIEVVKKYADDDDKMNQMFDWIEAELTRDDIDFRGAMLK